MNRIDIHTGVDDISKGIDPIIEFLRENNADHKVVYQVELALEELLVNVASYAYAPGTGKIEIEYEILDNPKMISIAIIDEGKEFNPLESKNPDITLPIEQREIGGLGIFLVKKTMDEINYDRKNGKNILIIKKKI